MTSRAHRTTHPLAGAALCLLLWSSPCSAQSPAPLRVAINDDASFTLSADGLASPVLRAQVSAQIDGRWIRSSSYPRHHIDPLAGGWEITFSGLPHQPDLRYDLHSANSQGLAEVRTTVRNTTGKTVHVNAIRMLDATGALNLGGPAERDRVLSDSFSEDTPAIRIRDLRDADHRVHRGVGSQLIYNRESQWSFFAGTGTSDCFLTLLRLTLNQDEGIEGYVAESTGTTEITRENSLLESPKEDAVPLSLELAPGAEVSSERLFFSVSRDYHHQLESYGTLIRELHHARTKAPIAMGWWSWTAYYYGLTEGVALTNAQWLSQNLSSLGYNFFHLDEGYQYARGEYTTPDASQFPHGMIALEDLARALDLTPGIWTAPFEVSERASIFAEHQDWLVHNASGQPIHLGWANNHLDRLYALDTTHPGAQEYLRSTYDTLVRQWGIRYIKLDFMDDSAVEGIRYRPATTAMEAQRIGLAIIRKTVGEDVLLDKDGSAMLNPVGFVDYGRIAQDTGHTFTATKEAAPAVAARFYMNRNFFVNDPDAFTVSTQIIKDHAWNGGKIPLTLEEAKASIALSAISGGMFEIGDDLPALGANPERLALVKNRDLLNMVKLGKASKPIDLMSFAPEDNQPSIFLLKEDATHSVLTLFNWTDEVRTHLLSFASLGLDAHASYSVQEIFDKNPKRRPVKDAVLISQPGHSVRMFQVTNRSMPDHHPRILVDKPTLIKTGESASFSVQTDSTVFPVAAYRWSFGDGTTASGPAVNHTYTQPGIYRVRLESMDEAAPKPLSTFEVTAEGDIPSAFVPTAKKRLKEP